ncbi:MAG: sigma-70 family RNA polymerase sigma factor [Vicingaceae bacterium]|nr:sigma-70 family RNA polymerase sigma factor [Vicingaceae bacterium]
MNETKNSAVQITDWVNHYSDDLYSWAYHKTSNKELAEDLVQETFMAAFKGVDNFEGNSSPKTWLFRILNNKIIDYYRQKKNFNHTSIDENESIKNTDKLFDENGHWETPTSFSDKEEHLLDNPDFNKILKKCIDILPENWAFAIRYKYIVDKSAVEICKELNISTSNYWQIIHRAKLQLKVCLEKNWTN